METLSAPPAIELEEITKTYLAAEVETRALDRVSISIAPGEHLAIAGPSGCGKTTLLSILGLLDHPTSGRYCLHGEPVSAIGPVHRARLRNREIGFVFQAFNLIGDLSVEDNVALPLTYRGTGRAERDELVAVALERVGMSHRARHLPYQLSGGQQQRAAVARAIVGRPSILLADEPTGNLDTANGEAVIALLGELNREGTTLLTVTHDPRYAAHAHRVVRMLDGRLVCESQWPESEVVPPPPSTLTGATPP